MAIIYVRIILTIFDSNMHFAHVIAQKIGSWRHAVRLNPRTFDMQGIREYNNLSE